jgi:hypothetical protein
MHAGFVQSPQTLTFASADKFHRVPLPLCLHSALHNTRQARKASRKLIPSVVESSEQPAAVKDTPCRSWAPESYCMGNGHGSFYTPS